MTDSLDPAESLRLPYLDDIPVVHVVGRALQEAVERRTGCVVLGTKAVGKSCAKIRGIGQFAEDEQAFQAAAPDAYRPRFVLEMHGVVGRTARELYLNLLDRVQPGGKARAIRLRRDEEQVRTELVAALRHRRIVLLVFDEAEKLSDDALEAVRTLLADAEQSDDERRAALLDGADVPAGGVGIVLIATPDLEARLAKTGELGKRWSSCDHVPDLSPDQVPSLYGRVFPRFNEHIQAIGVDRWETYVQQAVTVGRPMPLRVFDQHCRVYFGSTVKACAGDAVPVLDRLDVPFVAPRFVEALERIKW